MNPASGVPAGSGGLKCEQYSLGDLGYTGLRGLLRYNPTANLDILFSADYIHDSHNNGAEVLLYGNNPIPTRTAPNGTPDWRSRSPRPSSAASGATTPPSATKPDL